MSKRNGKRSRKDKRKATLSREQRRETTKSDRKNREAGAAGPSTTSPKEDSGPIPWTKRLLDSLEEQGQLNAVGFAPELDIRVEQRADGTQVVEEIVSVQGIFILPRSAVGGRFLNTQHDVDSEKHDPDDASRIVGLVGRPSEPVYFLNEPPDPSPDHSAADVQRVIEVDRLRPNRNKVQRIRKYCDTKAESGRRGAIVGGQVLEEVGQIEAIYKETSGIDPRDAEDDAKFMHERGISSETVRGRAIGRQVGRARRKRDKEIDRVRLHEPDSEGRNLVDQLPDGARESQEIAESKESCRLLELAALDELDREDLNLMRSTTLSRRQRAKRLGVNEKTLRDRERRLRKLGGLE